ARAAAVVSLTAWARFAAATAAVAPAVRATDSAGAAAGSGAVGAVPAAPAATPRGRPAEGAGGGGARHPPPWRRQVRRPPRERRSRQARGVTRLARILRSARMGAFLARTLCPCGGGCPAPPPRDRALSPRAGAPRDLSPVRRAHVRGAAARVRGRHVRELPRLRRSLAGLRALPLQRLRARRPRGQ